jgi:hypothetical protein
VKEWRKGGENKKRKINRALKRNGVVCTKIARLFKQKKDQTKSYDR